MQSASTSSQSITELLLRNIEDAWDRKNLPKGVNERLSRARAAEPSSTERILLDHGGMATWVAYVRATQSKVHFKGQYDQKAIIAAFENLSKKDRILVAQKVAHGQPHSSVATIINKINQKEGVQRHPTTSTTANPLPPTASSAVPTIYPEFENALPQRLVGVFGEPIRRALRITLLDGEERAAVRMVFPVSGLVDCVMGLRIDESKVEDLAMSLFKVRVNSEGHTQRLTCPEGLSIDVTMKPDTDLILKGAQDGDISDVFGPEIYMALVERTVRKPELAPGGVTQGVSMALYSTRGAVVNLSLGIKGGVSIRHKIYP